MEDLSFALEVMVLGFTVVMVALVSLYLLLLGFDRFFNRPASQAGKAKPSGAAVLGETSGTAQADRRITAAIIAAVYQYMQAEPARIPAGGLRVSVQPTAGAAANGWHMVGRRALLLGSRELETIRRQKKRETV